MGPEHADRLTTPHSFDWLAARIRAVEPRLGPIRLVAVDGPGGAGKSMFARRLAAALDDATIIETDDFASAADPLGWWDRFEREVLDPLSSGAPIRYRRWDWIEERLGPWREHRASDTVIVEGVSSARRAIADRLSFAIWVETPADERLARGLARDGAQARPFWERWMAAEDAHFALDATRGRADLHVDASLETDANGFLEIARATGPIDPRLRLAIDASIGWYEDVFASHGIGFRRAAGVWAALGPAPPFHSAVVTLDPGASVDDVRTGLADPTWGGLKDSFADVDAVDLGMELLFEAQWIHRPPPTAATASPAWTTVDDAVALAAWNAHADMDGVLLPSLLERPGFTFLERRDGSRPVAGAALRVGQHAVELSNVHGVAGWPLDWDELATVIAHRHPGLPIVGFETGADLDAATTAGWEAVGPLRIWAPG